MIRADKIIVILKKAEKNGYKDHLRYCPLFLKRHPETKKKFTEKELWDLMARVWLREIEKIIFSHSFAKAYFGEKKLTEIAVTCKYDGCDYYRISIEEFKKEFGNKTFDEMNKNENYEPEDESYRYFPYYKGGWEKYIKELVLIPENKRIDFLYKFIGEK